MSHEIRRKIDVHFHATRTSNTYIVYWKITLNGFPTMRCHSPHCIYSNMIFNFNLFSYILHNFTVLCMWNGKQNESIEAYVNACASKCMRFFSVELLSNHMRSMFIRKTHTKFLVHIKIENENKHRHTCTTIVIKKYNMWFHQLKLMIESDNFECKLCYFYCQYTICILLPFHIESDAGSTLWSTSFFFHFLSIQL